MCPCHWPDPRGASGIPSSRHVLWQEACPRPHLAGVVPPNTACPSSHGHQGPSCLYLQRNQRPRERGVPPGRRRGTPEVGTACALAGMGSGALSNLPHLDAQLGPAPLMSSRRVSSSIALFHFKWPPFLHDQFSHYSWAVPSPFPLQALLLLPAPPPIPHLQVSAQGPSTEVCDHLSFLLDLGSSTGAPPRSL